MQWFDNLWNNAPWILVGMIIVGIIQFGTVMLWEHLKEQRAKKQ